MHRKLVALRVRHAILDAKIGREERRPHPDSLRIMSLKKIRLRLKEEIVQLERRVHRPHPAVATATA
ncbi:YdcH family protein [Polymorphum gilvum]|uniref:YdcH family protein n=1 Tax=Polymorphum gilvum TaxID=991904 RepID=UPI00030C0EBC|nr:YdcH family protein [Polymorphum gilvum]